MAKFNFDDEVLYIGNDHDEIRGMTLYYYQKYDDKTSYVTTSKNGGGVHYAISTNELIPRYFGVVNISSVDTLFQEVYGTPAGGPYDIEYQGTFSLTCSCGAVKTYGENIGPEFHAKYCDLYRENK